MKAQFLVAAPMSGSGKTTIARGLMALLANEGYGVQPFKCGPDYIDTKFHASVCGRPSVNLDTFMAASGHVRKLYAHYGTDADVCVVEGMMGLYDGYDRDAGSSAEIARVLHLPIVLVVDAHSAAYSMAALLQGFTTFRRDLCFAGIIFNKVGSSRHEQMLRQGCSDLGIRCLGCLPKDAALEQGSRYLGLDFSTMCGDDYLVALLKEHVDWHALLETTQQPSLPAVEGGMQRVDKHVVVARNEEAFSFIYQEVLDSCERLSFFNPETEVPCLDEADLLYLPGGYPEKHLSALTANEACRKTIADYARQGGKVVAECGGMMYLCKSIVDDTGEHAMCGVLPYQVSARKTDRKLSLGYRRFMLDGREYRGHEFHYTQFMGLLPKSVTQVYNALGNTVPTPVIQQQNVMASYTHLYCPLALIP